MSKPTVTPEATEALIKAVKLVLALNETKPEYQVPGTLVKLDPMAEKQLYAALAMVPQAWHYDTPPCHAAMALECTAGMSDEDAEAFMEGFRSYEHD